MVAPKFVERFQQTTVAEGETVMLQCRAVGTPMPVLSWQKDGVTIDNTANVMVSGSCILHDLRDDHFPHCTFLAHHMSKPQSKNVKIVVKWMMKICFFSSVAAFPMVFCYR